MSDDIASLSPVQMDALREIGNVGAGNSATALSQIINRRIDMDVPRVSIVPLEEVPELVGGPDTMVVGVFLRVYGKAPSNILFLLPRDSAFYLVDMLMGKKHGDIVIEGEGETSIIDGQGTRWWKARKYMGLRTNGCPVKE